MNDIKEKVDEILGEVSLYPTDVRDLVHEALDCIDPDDYEAKPWQSGKADFDKRAAALKLAREHVSELLAIPNSRGYPAHSLNTEARITEELRVARYLLDGDA